MEVGHNKEASDGNDDADELYFFIRRGATGEIIGDFLIENGDCGASSENKYSGKEPA